MQIKCFHACLETRWEWKSLLNRCVSNKNSPVQGHSSFTQAAWEHTVIAGQWPSVKPWANQVTGREDSTRRTSDQPTLPYGHHEGCVAGTRTSGHSQRRSHLFSFVSQATMKDHCLHMGSSHNPGTKERPSVGQAGKLCRGRDLHHPSVCRCHSCFPVPQPLHGEHPTVTKGSERSHQEEGIS